MSVPVVWLNLNEEAPNRGYWDQGLLEDLFAGELWKPAGHYDFTHMDEITPHKFAVVVIPARQNAEYINEINRQISDLDSVLIILTGDEEGDFPVHLLDHDSMRVWLMTPQVARQYPSFVTRFLGCGYPPGMREHLKSINTIRTKDFFFSGQITHSRREKCVAGLDGLENGEVIETEGFIQGIEQPEYWDRMRSAKVAPAPGGPVSPDSFRAFEALEAGCVPLADNASGKCPDLELWDRIFGDGNVFFPQVANWEHCPGQIEEIVENWPASGNRVYAKWQAYKRDLAYGLRDDIYELSGWPLRNVRMHDRTTIIMPSSPIPSHPSTEIIEETIASIHATVGLEDVEILIMLDGVREKDEGYREQYEQYIERLLWMTNNVWDNVLPIIFDEHTHQGAMTRRTLHEDVHTETMIFVEHDTPLIGEFEWSSIYKALAGERVFMLRFHHEASILDAHKHMMLGSGPEDINGALMWPTIQWSQRPHIARTDVYTGWMDTYFGWESKTMIEDVMWGVVETYHREMDWKGWDKFRVFVYCPETGLNMKRSTTNDGRKNWDKGDMVVMYDGGHEHTPTFAPGHGKVIDG